MYYAILQRWEGEPTDTLCMQYPAEKKDECQRMFESLKKEAYKQKHPVTYRLIELDGEMQYAGKELQDWRKKNNVDKIIIANGKIHEDIPLYVQKDMKGNG
jgi:hypothetical protein